MNYGTFGINKFCADGSLIAAKLISSPRLPEFQFDFPSICYMGEVNN